MPTVQVPAIPPPGTSIDSEEYRRYLLALQNATVGPVAPVNARYWVGEADATLTNEQNLGLLTTGYLKVSVTAGAATPSTVTAIPAADVSGQMTVAQGGTGASTLAAHGVLVGNGTGTVAVTGTGTAGQVLTSNGASADPTFQSVGSTGIVVLDRNVVSSTVFNTTTPTTIYSFSMPGGTMGTTKRLRVQHDGLWNNTTGVSANMTLTITLGGTTIIGGSALTFAPSDPRRVRLEAWITNLNASNSQSTTGTLMTGPSVAGGTPDWGASTNWLIGGLTAAAIDTSSAQTVAIVVTNSVANTQIGYTSHSTLVELL